MDSLVEPIDVSASSSSFSSMSKNSTIKNTTENANNSAWILSKRYWYWMSLLLPSVPLITAYIAAQTGQGAWLWFTLVMMYAILPAADYIFGTDDANPDDELIEQIKGQRYYVYIMYCTTIMHWAALVGMAYVVSHYDWSWLSILGGALSAGVTNGLGLVAAHEMGHKVKDKTQSFCAKLVLACSGYGHFCIEHNKGHHKDVATPEDPASSKFGESIYKFVQREIPGAFRRAWGLELTRLHRRGKSEWSLDNEIIQTFLMTVVAYTLMLAYFGPVMIPFLAIASTYGWWQLTCANYVEHYGLLRQKKENGRYERCQPHHSWNSNHKVSNLITLHLQRHSDHHAHPTRPYQLLRDYEDVPSLPSGYPTMFVLAMIPPAWRAVMDHRVVEWAEGDMSKVNIDPDQKEEVFSRFHQPEVVKEAA
jgi:alkane 1-monooxygenase